jgi:hypothetical protein
LIRRQHQIGPHPYRCPLSPSHRLYTAYQDRGAATLYYLLERWGLCARALPPPLGVGEEDVYDSIHLLEVRAKGEGGVGEEEGGMVAEAAEACVMHELAGVVS